MSCCQGDPNRAREPEPYPLADRLDDHAARHEFFATTARHEDAAFHGIVAACCRRAADAIRRVDAVFEGEAADGE